MKKTITQFTEAIVLRPISGRENLEVSIKRRLRIIENVSMDRRKKQIDFLFRKEKF